MTTVFRSVRHFKIDSGRALPGVFLLPFWVLESLTSWAASLLGPSHFRPEAQSFMDSHGA